MPETKRGRERTGQNKEEWWRRQDIERALTTTDREPATTDRKRGLEGPTMQVIYTVDWDADERRTLDVEGFEELAYGVVLYDADGEEIGYVPHDQLIAIVPA